MHHRHTPALDGVRGIAILVVFATHTQPHLLAGGHIGVDLFFVLSGYLITSILLSEHAQTGSIGLARFYMRRALRLLPALFLMVAVVVAGIAIAKPEQLAMTLGDAQAILLYYYNWWILVDEHIRPYLHQRFFRHLWSLSIEEQFYIVWPWVLLLALGAARSRRAMVVVLVVGILGPAIARPLLWEGGSALWLYFRTDLRFDLLMWGALGAWLVQGDRLPARESRAGSILAWGGVGALVGFFAVAMLPVVKSGFLYVGGYSLIGLLAAWVIVAAAAAPPAILKRALEVRFLRWTGKISYGLYIWHIPIFWTVFELELPEILETVIAVGATYLVAGMSFRYWETPFLRMKARYAAKGTDAV
jgi:peptidoglycan/LPS O-acetylase OafA/YrhL